MVAHSSSACLGVCGDHRGGRTFLGWQPEGFSEGPEVSASLGRRWEGPGEAEWGEVLLPHDSQVKPSEVPVCGFSEVQLHSPEV